VRLHDEELAIIRSQNAFINGFSKQADSDSGIFEIRIETIAFYLIGKFSNKHWLKMNTNFGIGYTKIEGKHCILYAKQILGSISKNFKQVGSAIMEILYISLFFQCLLGFQ